MDIHIRRVYDRPRPGEGVRVLVDRLWPRGVKREDASWQVWAKEVAPSPELRTWFGHDPDRFAEFGDRYRDELARPEARERLAELRRLAAEGLVLLTASRDLEHSQAAVLKALLEEA